MDSDNQSKGDNEKDFAIEFKVFKHVDHSKRRSFLKLAKPDSKSGEPSCERNLQLGVQYYPNVSVKRESAANAHAVNIMCSMNHHNIVSMKAVGPKAQDDFLVFIEECDGIIDREMWRTVNDDYGHIPSETFQNIVAQIIEGIDFLRRNDTYHGNLTWSTTFFKRPYTVKLCNFRSNDSVSMEESQWQDWMFLRQMLKYVSDKAVLFNQSSKGLKLSYAEVDALIELIGGCDRSSLNLMKNIVLQDVFFWTLGRRTMFMMTTVSEFIRDPMFCDEINKSAVCEVKWDSDDINGSLSKDHAKILAALINHCNEYRARLLPNPPPPLDTEKKIDCVKLACASYTHQHQEDIKNICQGRVDLIFRLKYPMLFIELNRIIKARG